MPDNTIAQAYIQIKPSMEGMSSELKKALGEEGEQGAKSFGSGYAYGLQKVGFAATAAVGAAAQRTV